jgi:hypothetical protein
LTTLFAIIDRKENQNDASMPSDSIESWQREHVFLGVGQDHHEYRSAWSPSSPR